MAASAEIIDRNPYLAAREEWDARWGDLTKRSENWRRAFYIAALTNLALVIGMITIGFRSRVEPYIPVLDQMGRQVAFIPAKQVSVKDVRLQESAVFRWISNVRSVVTDPVVQRQWVDDVYAYTAANSAAQNMITEWYRDNSPFDRLSKTTVDVSVESVVQQSPRTFEVVWTEQTRDLYGVLQGTNHYRGIVTVAIQTVSDEKEARINPLGLFVTNVSWGEIVPATSGGK